MTDLYQMENSDKLSLTNFIMKKIPDILNHSGCISSDKRASPIHFKAL